MAPTLLDFTMHVGERQRAVVVRVVDHARSESDLSAGDVDDVVDADDVLFERRARGDDLERRSWLVDVLHGAVPAMLRRCAREGVRIEGRLVRQRENFAGLRRHDQHGAARGAVARDGLAQLALGDVLQIFVNRQLDGRARRRRTLEPAEGVPARVGLIEQLSQGAADLAVVGGLDAGEPFVVDADESQQLSGELFLRIEPAVFFDEPDAFEIELRDPLGLMRRHAAAHVDERPLLPQARGQRVLLFFGAQSVSASHSIDAAFRRISISLGTPYTESASTL